MERQSHVALHALFNGVLGLAERVADELEREILLAVRAGKISWKTRSSPKSRIDSSSTAVSSSASNALRCTSRRFGIPIAISRCANEMTGKVRRSSRCRQRTRRGTRLLFASRHGFSQRLYLQRKVHTDRARRTARSATKPANVTFLPFSTGGVGKEHTNPRRPLVAGFCFLVQICTHAT